MNRSVMRSNMIVALGLVIFFAGNVDVSAADKGAGIIPFDADHWDLISARMTEFQGRECLVGYALLKDFEFEDGILEVDMAVTEARAYAGFIFRMAGQGDYEHFYVRSHREGLYGDDLQYAPVTNGISSWQLYGGRLYVVERTGVVEIDADKGEIVARNIIPDAVFINDIAIDDHGTQYVSDTENDVIFRYEGEKWERWMEAPVIEAPNALMFHDGSMYIGNNGKKELLAVEVDSGKPRVVARLGEGNIDGIMVEKKGTLLVSHWEGKLFRVKPGGVAEKLLDTRTLKQYEADFGYDPETKTVLIPTFYDNRIISYKLD